MNGLLMTGFYNYVTIDSVIALLDYKIAASKKIVKSVKEEKPRNLMDVTRGKKANTLIVLTGDRYMISAIHRQQLAKRMCPLPELEPEEKLILNKGTINLSQEEIILDAQGESTRSEREKSKTLSSD